MRRAHCRMGPDARGIGLHRPLALQQCLRDMQIKLALRLAVEQRLHAELRHIGMQGDVVPVFLRIGDAMHLCLQLKLRLPQIDADLHIAKQSAP